jgi:hypothetical protein
MLVCGVGRSVFLAKQVSNCIRLQVIYRNRILMYQNCILILNGQNVRTFCWKEQTSVMNIWTDAYLQQNVLIASTSRTFVEKTWKTE